LQIGARRSAEHDRHSDDAADRDKRRDVTERQSHD
jgi:hypothetical protein